MKAITVRQPWAWAIAAGYKRVENRSRRTKYRGQIAIHAGLRWSTRGGEQDWAKLVDPEQFIQGAIIALTEITGCHLGTDDCCGDWGEGTYDCHPVYHWTLGRVHRFDPVPHRGQLGLWKVNPDVYVPAGFL